jgi:hypothetical protein
MDNTVKKSEQMESSAVCVSNKGSCSEAPEGATGQDPVESRTGGTPLIEEEHLSCSQTLENLEGLTKKVGSLGLRFPKKNRCGAARKLARKARLAEAPTGASDGGQTQPTSGDQPQSLQGPSTSAAHGRGSASMEQKSPEGRGHPQGPQKRQRLAGGTPGGGQAKRPKQTGQLSYARAAQEGIRVAIVCEDYPRSQISRDNFADIQRAIGSQKRGSPPGWSIHTGQRGQPLWSAKTQTPGTGW